MVLIQAAQKLWRLVQPFQKLQPGGLKLVKACASNRDGYQYDAAAAAAMPTDFALSQFYLNLSYLPEFIGAMRNHNRQRHKIIYCLHFQNPQHPARVLQHAWSLPCFRSLDLNLTGNDCLKRCSRWRQRRHSRSLQEQPQFLSRQ
jgi:hypothetical protein